MMKSEGEKEFFFLLQISIFSLARKPKIEINKITYLFKYDLNFYTVAAYLQKSTYKISKTYSHFSFIFKLFFGTKTNIAT